MRRALAAFTAALIAMPISGQPATAALRAGACPVVVSHATSKLLAPENTLPGIQAAAAAGAGAVELDVQWSSSNFPVLMHDATVDRTTNGTGAPATLGLGQLRALSAADYAPWKTSPYGGFHPDGSPKTPVPYGWEFMDAAAAGDLDVLVDVHATPTDQGMAKLRHYIGVFGWGPRTLVMGPAAWVVSMRGWEPGLRYLVIEYPPTGRSYTGEYLTSIGAVGYALPWDRVSPALVTYLHAYGLLVYAWTSDTPAVDVAANWLAVADAGVDGLVTNQPAAARTALAGRCAPPTTTPTTTPTTEPTTAPTGQPVTPPGPTEGS